MAARDVIRLLRVSDEDASKTLRKDNEVEEGVPPIRRMDSEESLCDQENEEPRRLPPIRSVKSNSGLVSPLWRRGCAAIVTSSLATGLLACAVLRAAAAVGARPSGLGRPQPAKAAPRQKQMAPWPRTCEYREMPVCPATALFANPEIHDVAAENLMRVGFHGLLAMSDRADVEGAVAAGFRNLSVQLAKHAPDAAQELDAIQLSRPHKDAVVAALRLLSDPRVQSIGFEVGAAIRDSPSTEPAYLKRRIFAKLQPRFEEILRLRREVSPRLLREAWAHEHQWNMTLDPENLRIMRASAGGTFAPVFVSVRDVYWSGTTRAPISPGEKSYGIMGGVVEEGRALLDLVKVCARLFDRELKVPTRATSLAGTYPFGAEILSCEMHTEGGRLNFMKAFFCPLKFGSQGLDALRAIVDMVTPSRSGEYAPLPHRREA